MTFQDVTFNGTTPVTTTLASNVALSNGQASYSSSTLPAGNHFITAAYSGDVNFTGGSAMLVEVIHATGTTTAVGSSMNPSAPGQSVTFTATVTPVSGSGTPSGMVTFLDGATIIGQSGLANGAATLTTSSLSQASHTITANYYSDATFASSTGSVTQVVTTIPQLSITKSHSGNFTQAQTGATYTVTVSNAVGAAATSGTVTVTENVPTGLTLVSMSGQSGSGWTCPSGQNSCTSTNPLAGGSSYGAITVTVNVANNAPGTVTNQVTVSGGGSGSASANDPTTITPSNPPPSSYSFSRAITISHLQVPNTDQTNFPVLISGTYSYLANTGSGGKVQNASGWDIVFTSDAAGTQALKFERELYSSTTGQVVMWVNVPTVSHTTDTTIYMWYGNASVAADTATPAAVWDANYKGVWHLGSNTSLSLNDSTSNGNQLSAIGSPGATSGAIGEGMSTTTSSGAKSGVFSGTTPTAFTWSGWVNSPNAPTSSDYNTPILITNGSGSQSFGSVWDHLDPSYISGTFIQYANGGYAPAQYSTREQANTTYYIAGTWDGSTLRAYLNGTNQASTSVGSLFGSGLYVTLGGWTGTIDEVRISAIARSSDWIKTEYNNQSSPGTFYAVGSETAH